MSFLRVIIPTYNGAEFLPRMVKCVRSQTMQDFHLIIVDDMSTDGKTWKLIQKLKPDKAIKMTRKGYAAGARNEGMKFFTDDLYTLWLDDDDRLMDDKVFERIKKNAEEHDYPDIIRLNYIKTRVSTGLPGNHHDRYKEPITVADICCQVSAGMPWSKAVMSEKCVDFPEDLLVDDCYQHIMQCDVCDTASVIHEDCYEWLVRENSITTSKTNVMRDSGWYLEIAKLMRQKEHMIHDYARDAADMRIEWIKRHHKL